MAAAERVAWTAAAWEDDLHWQGQHRRQRKRINQLIQACLRDAFAGIGKPEQLRESLSGCWSRRIDDEHRLLYRLERSTLVILACRSHDRCEVQDRQGQRHHRVQLASGMETVARILKQLGGLAKDLVIQRAKCCSTLQKGPKCSSSGCRVDHRRSEMPRLKPSRRTSRIQA